jgi:glycosyltransferase involved in cell wall biosynthesis
MRGARALVQHSVRSRDGDSEGTPLSILEAGASGIPVVSTRHGGIEDVVRHGETGLLVDEGDIHGMARHMTALVQSPDLAADLGARARAHIRAHHSMDTSIGNLMSVIEGAVARHGGNGPSHD